MSIDNHPRKTLLVSFMGSELVDNSITLDSLEDIFAPDNSSGGYANLTDLQDDIVVVRKFAGNFFDVDGSDLHVGPTADEAWRAWTYPYSTTDGNVAMGSGSAMYNLTGTSNSLTLVFTAVGGLPLGSSDLTFERDAGYNVKLPAITDDDIFYVIRKTKSNNKIVTFEPSARITANNLNTALDQNFLLGQEAEMWFQNFHKISPAIGQPGGLVPLDTFGQVPTEYVGGYRLSRASNTEPWDALNYPIKNLHTPSANNHAANKQYVDGIEQYGGNVTPQQVNFTITDGGDFPAGEDETYTPGLTWAQTDEEFFVVAIDGVLQIPGIDFTIPSPTTIQILGATNVEDVIDVRNMGRTGANTIGTATITSTDSTTARSLATRFADVVNVKDFGAVGNDAVDDTAAFNSAITRALATNNPILIPAGIYRVDNLDVIPNDIEQTLKIVGVGKRSSVIRHTGDGALITLGDKGTAGTDQDWGSFLFENIGVTTQTGTKGINFMWRFSGAVIRDSHFEGFTDGAIFSEGKDSAGHNLSKSWNSRVDNCSFVHNGSGILIKDNSWSISASDFRGNQYGIRTISGTTDVGGTAPARSGMNINGCNFGPANVACIALSGQQGCSIAGCYLDNNFDQTFGGGTSLWQYDPDLETVVGNAPCILFEGTSNFGISVSGCWFQGRDGVSSHIEIDGSEIEPDSYSGLAFIGNSFANTGSANKTGRYCIKITDDDDDDVNGLLYISNHISFDNVAGITNKESSFSVLERTAGIFPITTLDNRDMIHSSKSADIPVAEGQFSLWMSDENGSGSDGDIILRTKRADGDQDTKILIKHAPEAYTATAHTEERDLDNNSSGPLELANVLGTLINDLQDRGLIG
jgi:hypothetical protein